MIGFDEGGSMRPTLRTYRGAWGSAHELPMVPPRDGMREQEATLAHWFIASPPAHPIWPHYTFCCVHLRDVEGQTRAPTLQFPDASHEILLIALNPKLGPWSAENVIEKMLAPRTEAAWLTPLNLAEQLHNATDAQAVALTLMLARAMVDGMVPIEPADVPGGRDRWRRVIAATMEHLQTGGHASSAVPIAEANRNTTATAPENTKSDPEQRAAQHEENQ